MLLLIALLVFDVAQAMAFPVPVPVAEQTTKSAIVSYTNYKVFRVGVNTKSHFQVIEFLLSDPEMYNLWRMGKNDVDIMVHPRVLEEFHNTVKKETFDVQLLVDDVQKLIDAERAKRSPE
ncbi:uncharacterized protein LOC117582426 [Drosophila guanche]|uniref:Carboxypeptidase activation peptide domain-containing protein n=2 Tax=Drosophila guanche TaxID=7266 RepID=A0A3B0K132_DROGU|nr:uncharacterized protein LOC117582426 [Drosophila guanche]SPP79669.1 Hypothetical predicted protein [Drosophila guanche]